jgi:hypothetical protein
LGSDVEGSFEGSGRLEGEDFGKDIGSTETNGDIGVVAGSSVIIEPRFTDNRCEALDSSEIVNSGERKWASKRVFPLQNEQGLENSLLYKKVSRTTSQVSLYKLESASPQG